ncbi:MAG: hypothetical protein RIS09_57 [Actinomycetota bacterium]|jgi:glyoxylase-like metal-dependent hydrolase (beta-lactamase superfamily II)
MFITGFSAGLWATNCWILAPAPNAECIIIDPGYESLATITGIAREHNLKPVAVLLTHGHIDHMWSVTPVADGYDIPAMIHTSDRQLLADPLSGISEASRLMIEQLSTKNFVEPSSVKVFDGDTSISLLGYNISVIHLPGHTPGSVGYLVENQETFFSGDVLFQQGVGRTDLPGGDINAMALSMKKLFNRLADETSVLTGHGESTTIGQERVSNPYIQDWITNG